VPPPDLTRYKLREIERDELFEAIKAAAVPGGGMA
jgi:hypothetical protein